jgi:hypothetical protein
MSLGLTLLSTAAVLPAPENYAQDASSGVEFVKPTNSDVTGCGGGGGCDLHLVITPARPGEQDISLSLTDGQGQPAILDAVPTVDVAWTPLTPPSEATPPPTVTSVLTLDESRSRFTGTVPLRSEGWWEAVVTITPPGARSAYLPIAFWIMLPDPNATSGGPASEAEPEAQALFARGLTTMTALHELRYWQRESDGRGTYTIWDTRVRAGDATQPAAYIRWRTDRQGGQAGDTMVGDQRWITLPGQGWVAAEPVSFLTPPEWGPLYAGATGFQLGPIRQPNPDNEPFQLVTFWQPAAAAESGQPGWYAWWVGLDSGRVIREDLVSIDLYQSRSFSDFDQPFPINPPIATPATPTPLPGAAIAGALLILRSAGGGL